MKHLLFKSATFFLLLLSSCKEKSEEYEVIDWGTIGLQAESRQALPYYGKYKVVFVDSLGGKLELGISGALNVPIPVNKRSEHKFETYTRVYDEFRLSQSGILDIWARLTPEFSPAGPQAGEVADLLYIMSFRQNTADFDTLFSKMVFQGNWPEPLDDNKHHDSITILGREFKNVEQRENPLSADATVFYNQEFGIVAFRLYDGKLWRFEALF